MTASTKKGKFEGGVAWLFLAGLITCFTLIGARWIWLYRRNQPLDIDEAGYLASSFQFYHALVTGGFGTYVNAIENSGFQAPLTSTLASLVYLVTGPHIVSGFAVPLLAGAAIIVATYLLGITLGCRWIALVSVVLTATCPLIINYSRSYHFALPATLMSTMALVALLRSDRFRHAGWGAVFGICVGLMPLCRTMTLGFIPGMVLGAFAYTVADPSFRSRRLIVFSFSLILGIITASTWLLPNGRSVLGYLLNYGYGAHAAAYGNTHGVLNPAAWLDTARILIWFVYLPHFLVVVAGALTLLYLALQRIARNGFSSLDSFRYSKILPLVIYAVASLFALASTQNKGSAFIAPTVPAMIVLSVWAFSKISVTPTSRTLTAFALCLVSALAAAPLVDLHFAHKWTINVPVLGREPVFDGRGIIQLFEAAAGFATTNPAEPITPMEGQAWNSVASLAASKIGQAGVTAAFGFRHYLFNVNAVILQQSLRTGCQTSFVQVDPIVTGDRVAGNLEWLTKGDAAKATLLFTCSDAKAQFLPLVDQERMAIAARQVGFETIAQWPLPNGQTVLLWKRSLDHFN